MIATKRKDHNKLMVFHQFAFYAGSQLPLNKKIFTTEIDSQAVEIGLTKVDSWNLRKIQHYVRDDQEDKSV